MSDYDIGQGGYCTFGCDFIKDFKKGFKMADTRMNLSFAIERLKKILDDEGDLKMYLDISVIEVCKECGEEKSLVYDGFCHTIGVINLSNERCVWLQANKC